MAFNLKGVDVEDRVWPIPRQTTPAPARSRRGSWKKVEENLLREQRVWRDDSLESVIVNGFGCSTMDIARYNNRVNGGDDAWDECDVGWDDEPRQIFGGQMEPPLLGEQDLEKNGNTGVVELKPSILVESPDIVANQNYAQPPASLSNSYDRRLMCTRCFRLGHEVTACYRNPDGSIRNFHSNDTIRCYGCNRPGHVARDCQGLMQAVVPPAAVTSKVTVKSGSSCSSRDSLLISPEPMSVEEVARSAWNDRSTEGLRVLHHTLKKAEAREELSRNDPELYENILSYLLNNIEIA